MIFVGDSYCTSTLDRKRKRGDTREDGYRFMSYQKRKNADGSPVIYERWISQKAYENDCKKRLEYAKKKYYEKRNDPEYINKKRKYWQRPEVQERKKQYNQNRVNTPEKKERRKAYCKQLLQQRMKDPVVKLKAKIRSLISKKFTKKGFKKNNKAEIILGCSFSFFKSYIEAKFQNGMTWQNYGEWHFDHIMPLATARTEKEVMQLNKYTNFQPLWAIENILKRDKLPNQQLNLI